MSEKGKEGKKGGLGRTLLMGLAAVGVGAGAFWYMAPETFQVHVLDRLAGMLGRGAKA